MLKAFFTSENDEETPRKSLRKSSNSEKSESGIEPIIEEQKNNENRSPTGLKLVTIKVTGSHPHDMFGLAWVEESRTNITITSPLRQKSAPTKCGQRRGPKHDLPEVRSKSSQSERKK